HAAGAATVRTLNAGRTCAAVRPLSVATCRASSGQRASAAPAAATAQYHAAGAATVRTLNAGRICAAVRPLPAVTHRDIKIT
ncbi:hypothetical protein LJT65_004715, partial [Escherichia coli]|nr:hypothetical protein [Escherichia coli]EIK0760685.1 hypothetical protein [Escherichia coli]